MLSTAEGDVEIQRALQAGARGYLLKTIRVGGALGQEQSRRLRPVPYRLNRHTFT